MKIKNGTNSGFILPLAIIISAVVMLIGLTISTLVLSEMQFSVFSRESQKAFYAADAGSECALYWDLKKMAFDSESLLPIACTNFSGNPTQNPPNVFKFTLNFEDGSCVDITVDKSDVPWTIIKSLGHNTCAASSRKVERALQVKY